MFSRLKILTEHRFILAILTIIIALYLQIVPLANTLDFEFSAIMGIWFFMLGVFYFLNGTMELKFSLFSTQDIYSFL